MKDDLKERLRAMVTNRPDSLGICTAWHRNPDGPEAADHIEELEAENERLRRDRDDLLTFAKAIQIWRSDADSYDRECDHPQRNYCEDVELMEGCAGIVVRRVAARAALKGSQQ